MRSPYIIAATVVLALSAACTIPSEAHLYNNTGALVTVNACGTEKRLSPGEIFKLKSATWCKDPLKLSSQGAVWAYKSAPLGWFSYGYDKYVEQTEIGNHVVRFQVNRDGAIFVVPVTASLPLSADVGQPNGFPAKPDAGAS